MIAIAIGMMAASTGHEVRQDLLDHDAQVAGAEGARGEHVLPVRIADHRALRHTYVEVGDHDAEGDGDAEQRCSDGRDQREQQQQRRQRREAVGDDVGDRLGDAAVVAADDADDALR